MRALIHGQKKPITESFEKALRSFLFDVVYDDRKLPVELEFLVFPFTDDAKALRVSQGLRESSPRAIAVYVGETPKHLEEKLFKDALQSILGFSPPKEVYIGTAIHVSAAKAKSAPTIALPSVTKKASSKKHYPRPKFVYLSLVVVSLVSLPFVLLALSLALSFGAIKIATRTGSTQLLPPLLGLSKTTSHMASATLTPLTHLPVVGKQIVYYKYISEVLSETNEIALEANEAVSLFKRIALALLVNDNSFAWGPISNKLAVSLETLYRKSSFLSADVSSVLSYQTVIPSAQEAHSYLSYLPALSHLARFLPDLVGEEKPVTYLVLLQNNMELRPTGGFIGSFALIRMENGKIVSREVHDVYDADGQIQGYISPPSPIKDYLGEASWHMRDANWDPDFAVSARRVSWFLEKAMDQKADVIVGLDLSFLKALLTVTGPIEIPEFEDTVTAENMYELIQSRATENFFPGSIRKKTYLASVVDAALGKLTTLDNNGMQKLLGLSRSLIEQRSIQLWSPNESIQEGIVSLGADGQTTTPICEDSCIEFVQSINEANVGVNKANVAISRQVDATYELSDGTLNSKVNLLIKHSGAYKNDGEEDYKAYIRLLAPLNSEVKNVRVETSGSLSVLSPEIKHRDMYDEVGVYIEVPSGEQSKITFEWSHEATKAVFITWQKQAGVEPFSLSLTGPRGNRYNTVLSSVERKELNF